VWRFFLSVGVLTGIFCFTAVGQASVQAGGQVALLKLAPPEYPPLAQEAGIMGDVVVHLIILQDGSVQSAEVLSGPPLLRQAALESAKHSRFECQSCSEKDTTYLLTYTFGFRSYADCGSGHLRGAKCLYLWRCGHWIERARLPVIGQSQNRILVLGYRRCVESERSN
jgi:TonB family protein